MVELHINLLKGECMNNYNEEDHPIIGDDQGLDFLGSEFTGP